MYPFFLFSFGKLIDRRIYKYVKCLTISSTLVWIDEKEPGWQSLRERQVRPMESCQFRNVDFVRRLNVAVRSHISRPDDLSRLSRRSSMDYKPNDGITG